ncbi:hypothetical protein [Mesobacillus subterraneus]|uniref:hypothetical protein n=1 Tax=Mesobacillus subterraneus TaxID=285983 RepID=UPI0014753823|nr:hypothetical protein [Mesobacillus subterraneus]
MLWIIWGAAGLVCLYSIAFGVTLWKQKNKSGAIVVIMLSVVSLILPYFTYVKNLF